MCLLFFFSISSFFERKRPVKIFSNADHPQYTFINVHFTIFEKFNLFTFCVFFTFPSCQTNKKVVSRKGSINNCKIKTEIPSKLFDGFSFKNIHITEKPCMHFEEGPCQHGSKSIEKFFLMCKHFVYFSQKVTLCYNYMYIQFCMFYIRKKSSKKLKKKEKIRWNETAKKYIFNI